MSTKPLATVALVVLAGSLACAACSDENGRPPRAGHDPEANDGTGGAAGAGGGGPTTGRGGEGGGSTFAAGGAAGFATCGDQVRDDEEQCDGADTGGLTCWDLGFDTGTLGCAADCTFDTAQCSGIEDCHDGRDNDGDGRVDCLDADDCEAACSNPCADVPVLEDPSVQWGSTEGSANETDGSCAATPGNGGAEIAYQFVAASTGVLDVSLETAQLLNVAIRMDCGDPETELGCAYDDLTLPITAGESVFVIVEGSSPTDEGSFRLSLASRALNVCGDGYRDPDEECDDGGQDSGDGCGETCLVESSESEEDANVYTDPFYGQIRPAGDVDVIQIEVAEAGSTLTAETLNLNDGSCAAGKMDSYIEILGPDVATVLASDDDSASGYCARAVAVGLDPGTYYVVVSAASEAAPERAVFPYWLYVTLTG